MSTLNVQQKKVLREASRDAVAESFGNLSKFFRKDRWLKKTNRYSKNTIEKLKKDKANTLIHQDLAAYISASAPIHCTDGWSYLGRALDALSQGDRSGASHLAYYAELRAAMSLLATEGIGVFNSDHYILDANQQCKRVPSNLGTHRFVWPALQYWAQRKAASDLLSSIISPGGYNLSEWLKAASYGTSDGYLTDGWFKSWGLDLKRFGEDRDDRNNASYRPTNFIPHRDPNLLPTLKFINELWSLCEPSSPSRFEILDRYLLRSSLERAFKATKGKDVSTDPASFHSGIEKAITSLSPRGTTAESWKRFLSRKELPADPQIISHAMKTDGVESIEYALQVTARAALLLRVATGACSTLIKKSGIQWSDLEFWWHSVGEQKGLWRPGDEPADTTDLWADINDAINQLSLETAISCSEWRRESHGIISLFGECDRIALWGIKPID